MTRNKMIDILTDYLEGVTFKDDKGTAEDILYLVEQAGMLPPDSLPNVENIGTTMRVRNYVESRYKWEDEK